MIDWNWFIIGFVVAVAYGVGRLLFAFNTIVTVKEPCAHHTWDWDKVLGHHVCKVCNHIAGETL